MSMAGWPEHYYGTGLRRDHRTACPSAQDKKPGRRCQCPYRFWVPDPSKRSRQRRVTIDGALSLAEAKREKERLIVEARMRIANGIADPHTATIPTLCQWAHRCLTETWRDLSPRTIQSRESAYRLHIHPHLGHLNLDAVTPFVIDSWLNDLIGTAGVRRYIEVAAETMENMLNIAVDL
jgi:hypothetical protein